jgi:hypothetical protein
VDQAGAFLAQLGIGDGGNFGDADRDRARDATACGDRGLAAGANPAMMPNRTTPQNSTPRAFGRDGSSALSSLIFCMTACVSMVPAALIAFRQ